MTNKLLKPYSDKQKADFVCEYQGLNYYEDENCVIMYADTEKIENGEAVDRTQDVDYIAEQNEKSKQNYYNEYLTKLTQYKSAIEQTELFGKLGKLTQEEVTVQETLLLNLINQAEELYDTQVGELL